MFSWKLLGLPALQFEDTSEEDAYQTHQTGVLAVLQPRVFGFLFVASASFIPLMHIALVYGGAGYAAMHGITAMYTCMAAEASVVFITFYRDSTLFKNINLEWLAAGATFCLLIGVHLANPLFWISVLGEDAHEQLGQWSQLPWAHMVATGSHVVLTLTVSVPFQSHVVIAVCVGAATVSFLTLLPELLLKQQAFPIVLMGHFHQFSLGCTIQFMFARVAYAMETDRRTCWKLRRQLEEKDVQSGKATGRLLENFCDAVLRLSADLKILDFGAMFVQLLGRQANEISNSRFCSFLSSKEDVILMEQSTNRLRHEESSHPLMIRTYLQDGYGQTVAVHIHLTWRADNQEFLVGIDCQNVEPTAALKKVMRERKAACEIPGSRESAGPGGVAMMRDSADPIGSVARGSQDLSRPSQYSSLATSTVSFFVMSDWPMHIFDSHGLETSELQHLASVSELFPKKKKAKKFHKMLLRQLAEIFKEPEAFTFPVTVPLSNWQLRLPSDGVVLNVSVGLEVPYAEISTSADDSRGSDEVSQGETTDAKSREDSEKGQSETTDADSSETQRCERALNKSVTLHLSTTKEVPRRGTPAAAVKEQFRGLSVNKKTIVAV